jgi:hypothetical protein
MATVTVKWSGNPPCGADSTPYVGETYSLYLNQTFFSTDVTAAIEGTFVSEGPGGTGYDRTYTFTFDDTAIPSGFTALDSCHIKSVACVSSCCEELRKELDNMTQTALDALNVANVLAGNSGAVTYNPPSLADGSGVTTTVTVTGAALGDFAEAAFTEDTQGVTVSAWVSAADTVSVRFQNETGGVVDLNQGTLKARAN